MELPTTNNSTTDSDNNAHAMLEKITITKESDGLLVNFDNYTNIKIGFSACPDYVIKQICSALGLQFEYTNDPFKQFRKS